MGFENKSTIQFLFDYLSPYAYLAWTQIQPLARRHQRVVEPQPILLAGLLNATGQKGPAEVEAERLYIFKDLYRTTSHLGVPFVPPPSHPFNPLLALRVSLVPTDNTKRVELVDGIYKAVFGSGKDISDSENLGSILADLGFDAQTLITRAASTEINGRTGLKRGKFRRDTVDRDS
ncbi:MAG: DsbA family protein [Bdellovibrionota bacterium]